MTNPRCQCENCFVVIQFHADDAGKRVPCPACGRATNLFILETEPEPTDRIVQLPQLRAPVPVVNPPAETPRRKPIITERQSVLEQAARFQFLSNAFLVLAPITVAISIILGIAADASGAQVLKIDIAIIGLLLAGAFWSYLTAQIIYIRANTIADKDRP